MTDAIQRAKEILQTHWDGALPVDVNKIAISCGINVEYKQGIEGDMDVSGKISTNADTGKTTVEINACDTHHRQRYSLAHQIAHFALGHGDCVDKTEKLFGNNTSFQSSADREAKTFANELLIPDNLVNFLLEQKDVTSLQKLSEIFGVSVRLMEKRLMMLGWLPPPLS